MEPININLLDQLSKIESLPGYEMDLVLGQERARVLADLFDDYEANLLKFWKHLTDEEKRRLIYVLGPGNVNIFPPEVQPYLPLVCKSTTSGGLVFLTEKEAYSYPDLSIEAGQIVDPWRKNPDEWSTVAEISGKDKEICTVCTLWYAGEMYWLSIHQINKGLHGIRTWWPVHKPDDSIEVGARQDWLQGFAGVYLKKWTNPTKQ